MSRNSPEQINSKSVASLILGILSLVIPLFGFFLAIAAIILSRQSINEMSSSYSQGKGLSIAGRVCGALALAGYCVLFLYLAKYWF
ncbi:DUF4190 domain-containing protein [Paenibacillus brevis]|uniref:DUF4190 domain-containing protein n=1 Tax=Paenibacillus brevis TaxID=2841508 RepID=A0ABS6FQP5_9BACL|nr:DUF4190 domain-containing protein [Paenibacillus brevis]MBU5671792.1 DUF4190 domain-containing protein [Paenibacillus brevis]